jgi:cell division protein FtsW
MTSPTARPTARQRTGPPARCCCVRWRPTTCCWISTLLLVALGLVMVFSASAMRQLRHDWVAVRHRPEAGDVRLGRPADHVRRVAAAGPGLPGGGVPAAARHARLLVVVQFAGKEVNGGRSWIPLPMGFNLQPAELAKLALALWGADLLVRKQKLLDQRSHLLVPLVPVAAWCWC